MSAFQALFGPRAAFLDAPVADFGGAPLYGFEACLLLAAVWVAWRAQRAFDAQSRLWFGDGG